MRGLVPVRLLLGLRLRLIPGRWKLLWQLLHKLRLRLLLRLLRLLRLLLLHKPLLRLLLLSLWLLPLLLPLRLLRADVSIVLLDHSGVQVYACARCVRGQFGVRHRSEVQR